MHQNLKNDRTAEILQLVAIFLLLALLFWIILTGTGLFRDTVDEIAAREIAFAEKDYFNGYVFRDEAVFSSRNNGPVDYVVHEGDMLTAGDTVAGVYLDDSGTDKRERAAVLYDEIARLTAALDAIERGDDTRALTLSYAALMQNVSKGSYHTTAAAANDVTAALMTHAAALGSADAYRTRIDELRAEATALVQYVSLPEVVTTTNNGRFFKSADGYEALFGLAEVAALTPEKLDTLLANPLDIKDAIGKLVIGNEWYVVLPTARDATLTYTVNQFYTVEFTQCDVSLTMQLTAIAPSNDGSRALLVLHADQYPEGFDFERRQSVAITRRVHEGLCLPAAALSTESNTYFVYMQQDGKATRRPVTLLYNKGSCIVAKIDEANGIMAGARLLTTERRLFEGKALGG